ncbi:MAG TPA: sporulation sigma factor SigE, partial [Firmicutes bacterium]|nr:sporulation sigma factor SigE [Bacillota bacterium]
MIEIIKNLLKKIFAKYNEFFFVGSSDILPPPLDKDKELELVKKSQSGDIEARNKLIEHNLRLVVFIAKKYEGTLETLEDLVSIGTIGLIKGINTYKIDKNIRLATYASRCISNEILMYLRKNKKRVSDISFEEALSFDAEGNELHLEDIIVTDEDSTYNSYEKKTDIEILKKYIDTLDKRDREIMIMRYGLYNTEEYTQK